MKNKWHILFGEANELLWKEVCLIGFSTLILLPIVMKSIIGVVEVILGALIGYFIILTFIRKLYGKDEVIISIKNGEIYYKREANFYNQHPITDISHINKFLIYSKTPKYKLYFTRDGKEFKWEFGSRFLSEKYKEEIREIIGLLKEELSKRGVDIVEK